jgi:site-specific recombinase XerD
MRHAGQARYGNRLNGLIVVLWRAGLRINEALSLTETDLEEQRGSILVRPGKNDRRRQVGMDAWGWSSLHPGLAERETLPVGPLFCVIAGPTPGHAWSASAANLQLHQLAVEAGVRRALPVLGWATSRSDGAGPGSRLGLLLVSPVLQKIGSPSSVRFVLEACCLL